MPCLPMQQATIRRVNAPFTAKRPAIHAQQTVDRTTDAVPSSWNPAAAAVAAAAALALVAAPPCFAVAGGKGISSSLAFTDQTNADWAGFQFTKADLRGANFTNAKLTNANLFGALAEATNFSGADMRFSDLEGANFEDANLTNAILEGAQVAGARFGGKININGSDWTDVLLRKDVQMYLCKIADGVNPVTGVKTKDSLLCPN